MERLDGIKSRPQRRGRPIRQIFKFKLVWGHEIRGWDSALADELRNARLDEHPTSDVPDDWITAIACDRISGSDGRDGAKDSLANFDRTDIA